jgi:hypothetical protein
MQLLRKPGRGRRLLLGALGVGAAAGMAAAAVAVVYATPDRLDIADRKSAVHKVVATVERNAPLTVIAQEGRWYKVEVGGKQGFVASSVVAQKPGGKKGQSVSLSKVTGGVVPELETAAAVKGADEATIQYASSEGLSTDGLKELFRLRDSIDPDEYAQFQRQGPRGTAQAAADGQGHTDDALAAAAAGSGDAR